MTVEAPSGGIADIVNHYLKMILTVLSGPARFNGNTCSDKSPGGVCYLIDLLSAFYYQNCCATVDQQTGTPPAVCQFPTVHPYRLLRSLLS